MGVEKKYCGKIQNKLHNKKEDLSVVFNEKI